MGMHDRAGKHGAGASSLGFLAPDQTGKIVARLARVCVIFRIADHPLTQRKSLDAILRQGS
jgi:hypothetical protein